MRGFHCLNLLLKEEIKVLEVEKNKHEEELTCSNIYVGSLKSRLSLMIISSMMKSYLERQPA